MGESAEPASGDGRPDVNRQDRGLAQNTPDELGNHGLEVGLLDVHQLKTRSCPKLSAYGLKSEFHTRESLPA